MCVILEIFLIKSLFHCIEITFDPGPTLTKDNGTKKTKYLWPMEIRHQCEKVTINDCNHTWEKVNNLETSKTPFS
jgi:hypothetical protein